MTITFKPILDLLPKVEQPDSTNSSPSTQTSNNPVEEFEPVLNEFSQDIFSMSEEEIRNSYDEFTANLQNAGIKTTKLGKNETTFAEYGAALSDELKQMIIDSFDDPEDYILQQELAGLFTENNYVNTNKLIQILEQSGYTVERTSVKTSYIKDYKKYGDRTGVVEGGIAVLTIRKPGTNAEIKIADTNGNGAIEVEELFMNELLTGISKSIDPSKFGAFQGVNTAGGDSFGLDGNNSETISNKAENDSGKDSKIEVSRAEFNKMVDELVQEKTEGKENLVASEKTEIVMDAREEIGKKYVIK